MYCIYERIGTCTVYMRGLVHVLFIGEDWYMYCIYERIGTCTVYMRGLVHVLYI